MTSMCNKEESAIEQIKRSVDKVQGWLRYTEGAFLYRAAKQVSGRGVIVEIGSWKGKSTIWLAKGSKDGSKVKIYAIDPHTGSPEHRDRYGDVWTFPEFKRNIEEAGVDDIVLPVVKTSREASKNWNYPVEFMFIDGAHDYDSVKTDFELWYPHIIYGGVIAFHDTIGWEGPRRLVKESVYKSRNFKDIRSVGSVTYATKVKQISIKDVLKNRYLLCIRNFEEMLGKLSADSMVKHVVKRCLYVLKKKTLTIY